MDRGRVKSTTGLNLRGKPNGSRVAILNHNEQFTILDEVGFYRIRTASGDVGYVHADYVEKLVGDASVSAQTLAPTESLPPWSPVFQTIDYNNPEFVGEKVRIDKDFAHSLDQLAKYADRTGIKVWVTSSLRQLNRQVKGAIVPPAGNSCHHIGHAIDMNVLYDGVLFNSRKLKKSNHANLPKAVLNFIDLIRANPTLRWGGDFSVEDPVHIDDNLYNKQKMQYLAKLDSRIDQLNA